MKLGTTNIINSIESSAISFLKSSKNHQKISKPKDKVYTKYYFAILLAT